MGNWNITIVGTGPHHNGKDYDADQIFKETVEKLETAGQSIGHASITVGSAEAGTEATKFYKE